MTRNSRKLHQFERTRCREVVEYDRFKHMEMRCHAKRKIPFVQRFRNLMVLNEHGLSENLTTSTKLTKMKCHRIDCDTVHPDCLLQFISQWDGNMSIFDGKYAIIRNSAHYTPIGSHFNDNIDFEGKMTNEVFSGRISMAFDCRCSEHDVIAYGECIISEFLSENDNRSNSMSPTWINMFWQADTFHAEELYDCAENKSVALVDKNMP